MASNRVLQPVRDRGWLQGFGNLTRQENRRWWGTRLWLVQVLIWLLIVNGLLTTVLLSERDAAAQGRDQAVRQAIAEQQLANAETEEEAEAARAGMGVTIPASESLLIFFLFLGMAPGVGVAIIGQEALVQEKQSGTGAWVLSKPISRTAFVLSKITGNALGILVTMVAIQGAVGYVLIRWLGGHALYPIAFMGALGLVFLSLMFYLTLTVMLGTLFASRGPVIGIPLAVLFGFQIFTGIAPWLFKVMPWVLVFPPGDARSSHALLVALGQPLPSWIPTIATLAWCLVFAAVAIWRFNREEF
jgi:ABC-2 type transport system permease protein